MSDLRCSMGIQKDLRRRVLEELQELYGSQTWAEALASMDCDRLVAPVAPEPRPMAPELRPKRSPYLQRHGRRLVRPPVEEQDFRATLLRKLPQALHALCSPMRCRPPKV